MFERTKMDRAELLAKLREIMSDQLAIDEEKIIESASFVEDLGVDSLDLLQLVTAIEDELSIAIPDEAFENLSTVGDALTIIEGLK
jgi:acyl carrier protein